jgi:hypothetical protein
MKRRSAAALGPLFPEQGSANLAARRYLAAHVLTRPPETRIRRPSIYQDVPDYGLFALSPVQRLAFEMALHEEAERRAMEGELAELERAWKEAEEIAAISDNLFLPAGVEEQLERIHGTTHERGSRDR